MATKTEERVTDWIPATTKPALPGWYDVRYRDRKLPYYMRRYFDGTAWRFNPTSAACQFGNDPAGAQGEHWRGMASALQAVQP